MTIPSFINSQDLIINRTSSSHVNGSTLALTAMDPEGDSFTLSQWTQDVGPATVMPQQELCVAYQEHGKESASVQDCEKHPVGTDEAYDLWRALKHARCAENIDNGTIGYLMADLARTGGLGGAC